MQGQFFELAKETARNFRDFLPILAVIAIFQWGVVGEPMPDLEQRIVGIVLTLIGLTFFVRGLEMSIFPLGASLAEGLARRGSVTILIVFGFAVGFGTTVAEPALASVSTQAAEAAAGAGSIGAGQNEIARFAAMLRFTVAGAVGIAVAVGVLRIVRGWRVAWFVLPGYTAAALLVLGGDSSLSAVALDAGSAATSAINVPLMVTLGTGLATVISGRNPLLDGFGVVALASLTPMLVMLLFSVVLG